jgi:predicted AAA+ superfamily ATPase
VKFVELFANFNYYSHMTYLNRAIQLNISKYLTSGKSILLLGPRQTGKSTLLAKQIQADLNLSFLETSLRRKYESDPDLLIKEIKGFRQTNNNFINSSAMPLIIIDEIQKVPMLMDAIQYCIDQKLAKFVLTGSSARKLKQSNQDINLLPGRVIMLKLDGLSIGEIKPSKMLIDPESTLNMLLIYGSLPEIFLIDDLELKEQLLTTYVKTYLEEEIRQEALVRNLVSFSKFLSYAAIECGNSLNINNLSQEIGVSRNTIAEYLQILRDCLIIEQIDPITTTTSRRRLTKASKYLFFDLGVRRVAANEGSNLPIKYYANLFEQFIGIEIIKLLRTLAPQAKLMYWRDHAGAEVDFIIEYNHIYTPIEVKWSTNPNVKDCRHLVKFQQEYPCSKLSYIICQVERVLEITDNIIAIPWQQLELLQKSLG